jgi:hypothetical protein
MPNGYPQYPPPWVIPPPPYYDPYLDEDPWRVAPGRMAYPPDLQFIRSNPLAAGVQFGMLGAASGLGYAAVQRAIRMRMGNRAPVGVVKPLMIGTLIGSTLGVGGSMWRNKRIPPAPRPETWRDVSNKIYDDVYGSETGMKNASCKCASCRSALYRSASCQSAQYAGLMKIAGFWSGLGRTALTLGDLALWLNPATLPYRLGAEVMYRGGKGAYHLARGEKKKALGQALMGLGGAAFGAAGRGARAVGSLARLGRFARPAAKAVSAGGLLADVGLGTVGGAMAEGAPKPAPAPRPKIKAPTSGRRFAGLMRMANRGGPPPIQMPGAHAFRRYM